MRVLFLDFDGPLHPVSSVADWASTGKTLRELRDDPGRGLFRWNDTLADMLAAHTDVAIVVHSGWRTMTREFELREYLGRLGERFIGTTEVGPARYPGIQRLVDRFGFHDYVILDDATHEFPAGLPELISVDPEKGLSEPAVRANLLAWLEAPRDLLQFSDASTGLAPH
jgi:hypothetical protein